MIWKISTEPLESCCWSEKTIMPLIDQGSELLEGSFMCSHLSDSRLDCIVWDLWAKVAPAFLSFSDSCMLKPACLSGSLCQQLRFKVGNGPLVQLCLRGKRLNFIFHSLWSYRDQKDTVKEKHAEQEWIAWDISWKRNLCLPPAIRQLFVWTSTDSFVRKDNSLPRVKIEQNLPPP